MCGIAGFLSADSQQVTRERLNVLVEDLRHRGPDGWGYLRVDGQCVERGFEAPRDDFSAQVLLVHRRLSILDLSDAAAQPMQSEDGRYHIVFNGEIYNYLELRRELEKEGLAFRTRSDTEVLLNAYRHWGVSALPRLVGMFAFAIFDGVRRTVLLARDFFGIKPLYVARVRGGVAFASEIPALLRFAALGREVDPQRLYEYLRYGVTDHTTATLFREVSCLPPAHYLECPLDAAASAEPVRYWRLDLDARLDVSFDEAAARLRSLFLDNIRLHLRSDVPVGAALSGGIDSSAIVAGMRHVAQGSPLDVHAFSYVASEPAINEERWVDLVVRAARATVGKVSPTAAELGRDLSAVVAAQGEPFSSTSIYAQYRVFQLAHEAGVKVMLDGQGADELLAGYRHYLCARLATLLRKRRLGDALTFLHRATRLTGVGRLWLAGGGAGYLVPDSLHRPLRRLAGKDLVPAWLNERWFREREVRFTPLSYAVREKDALRHALHNSIGTVGLPALLRYEDRNSMAFSIESRVPFLTPAMAEFVFALPEEYVLGPDGLSKSVFRAAMRGIVPDEILDRRDKIGFATSEREWMESLRPWYARSLASDAGAEVPFLRMREVRRRWDATWRGAGPLDPSFWRWSNIIEWARQFDVAFA